MRTHLVISSDDLNMRARAIYIDLHAQNYLVPRKMATISYPSSSANSSLSFDSGSPSLPDISDDFRLLLVRISEELDDEKTTTKIRYIYERQLGPNRENMDVFAILRKLNKKGTFTAYNVGPLEELLDHCDRHDLINDKLRPYCKKLASQLTQEADPQLDAGEDGYIDLDLNSMNILVSCKACLGRA